ncbi:MAG: hypothetical protein R3B99_24020 [Polyangiales bacterium]
MRMCVRKWALGLACLVALGCGDDDTDPVDASSADAATDGALDGALDGGLDAGPMAPPWPNRLPATSTLGDRRGRVIARSIVHLHSPLSHDACDGEGWVDGELADPDCLAHFRAALCALRIDAAMVTDHAPHVNEVDFRGALWLTDDDEPIGDPPYASRMACPDDPHRPMVTVGSENTLMPLGLRRHPGEGLDVDALESLYDGSDPEALTAFRDAGALVWVAHTEQQDTDQLRTWGIDGLELYNLHADADPRIREAHLGDEGGDFGLLLEFMMPRLRLAPDLAVLAFLSRQDESLARWDTLLSEGRRVAGTGGCDAHENTFGTLLADGERADSYRRMMSWITNHVLVDTLDPDGMREALEHGRLYATHEVLGTPVGFDFVAQSEGTTFEMGDAAPLGATLRVARPSLPEGFPSEPAPDLTIVLYRAAADGAVEVARTTEAELVFEATTPGAYRVEVRMMPNHILPFVETRADRLMREQTWVYSNPIFVDLAEPLPEEPAPVRARARTNAGWRQTIRRAERAIVRR